MREVIPGAAVNIVLKADQPTGRTVSGVVGDVLTEGNHHVVSKCGSQMAVVGRVQSMATGAAANKTTQSGGAVWRVEAESSVPSRSRDFPQQRRGLQPNEEGSLPAEEIGLDAYVTYAKPRGRKSREAEAPGWKMASRQAQQTRITCLASPLSSRIPTW